MQNDRAKIQAALFDLDGVVVFTDRYHFRAWLHLCQEKGWDFSEKINEACRGVPRLASLEIILRHNGVTLPEEEKEALADWKNRRYVELLQEVHSGDLYPGVVPFLERIRALGIKTALCSSSRNAKLVLEILNITNYFNAIVTGCDIANAKPHPEIFQTGAQRLGVAPEACIVFEDAAAGVEAALAAGMRCVGIGSTEYLGAADRVIQNYRDAEPLF
jgi:beta-phosphoglucomutase